MTRQALEQLKTTNPMAFHRELETFAAGEYHLDNKHTVEDVTERFYDEAERQEMRTNALLANERLVFAPTAEDVAGMVGLVLILISIIGLTAIFETLR